MRTILSRVRFSSVGVRYAYGANTITRESRVHFQFEITTVQVKIIKAISPAISAFLADLFNDCIKLGFFTDEFKLAIISPLLK